MNGNETISAAQATKSQRTRQRVLDAAATVFGERGYQATNLAGIAAAAGLKTGSLYYHFASKDELIEAVMRHCMEWIHEEVRAAVIALGERATPRDRLRRAISAHLDGVRALGPYALATVQVVGQLPDDIRRRHFQVQESYGAYWGDLFDAARDAGEIRDDIDLLVVRMLIIKALNGTADWPAFMWADPERLADTIDRLLFGGLDAPGPDRSE